MYIILMGNRKIKFIISSAKSEISVEGTTALHFLQMFVRLAKLPRTVLSERCPTIILNQFEYLAVSNKA